MLAHDTEKKGTIDMASRPAVHLHIAGERFDTGSGGSHSHIDPSTGQIDATIPLAGPGEVDRAVNAADAAFRDWRRTPPEERRRLLLRLADLIEANAEEFGRPRHDGQRNARIRRRRHGGLRSGVDPLLRGLDGQDRRRALQ